MISPHSLKLNPATLNLSNSLATPVQSDPNDYSGQLLARIQAQLTAARNQYGNARKTNTIDISKFLNTIPDISRYAPSLSNRLTAPTGGRTSINGNVDNWIVTAYKILGIPLTPTTLAHERFLINKESGGNPRAINNWDSNAKAGHPSKGIEQTIDSTFRRYALQGHSNIWNPIDNIIASLGYRRSRYGSYDIGNYKGGY